MPFLFAYVLLLSINICIYREESNGHFVVFTNLYIGIQPQTINRERERATRDVRYKPFCLSAANAGKKRRLYETGNRIVPV